MFEPQTKKTILKEYEARWPKKREYEARKGNAGHLLSKWIPKPELI